MRTKNVEWVDKNVRLRLLTTDQRLLAEIADKNQELIRINRAILKTLGGSLKKEKKDDEIVELLEEQEIDKEKIKEKLKERQREIEKLKADMTKPIDKEKIEEKLKGRTEASAVPTNKGKKKWQRKRK